METRPLLYILDEPPTAESVAEPLHHDTSFEIVVMHSAGELLAACRERKPAVILAEVAVVYGGAAMELEAITDPQIVWATVRALHKLKQEGCLEDVYVILLHTGSFLGPREISELRETGIIQGAWAKPYDTLLYTAALCQLFDMPNPYPRMTEWTPDETVPWDQED